MTAAYTSIPIPGPRYDMEPDPFPEPRCAFCRERILPGEPGVTHLRQSLHAGFHPGGIEAQRPGRGALAAHSVCYRPEAMRR